MPLALEKWENIVYNEEIISLYFISRKGGA